MQERIPSLDNSASEEARKELARRYGLSEDSTWQQIDVYSSDLFRRNLANKKGLPADATWEQIDATK